MLPGYPPGWPLCALSCVPGTQTLQSRAHPPLPFRNQEVGYTDTAGCGSQRLGLCEDEECGAGLCQSMEAGLVWWVVYAQPWE